VSLLLLLLLLKLLMMATRQSSVPSTATVSLDDAELSDSASRPKTPPTALLRVGSDASMDRELARASTQTGGIVRHFIDEMNSRRRQRVARQRSEIVSVSDNGHRASSSSSFLPSNVAAAAAADGDDDEADDEDLS